MMQVNKDNFEKEVIKSDIPVVIDFWAAWCRPCQMMGPVFEELAPEFEGKLKFVKINVEESQDLATQFGITGIPAIVLVKNGEEVDRFTGFFQKDMLKAKIDFMMEKL
jgi:thioredoxin 1